MDDASGGGAVLDRARAQIVLARRARHQLRRQVAEIEREAAAAGTGYRSTTRLIQELWRLDRTEAARLVDEAEDLCPRVALSGQTLPARLPASGEAAEAGLLGDGHIRVLRATMARIGRIEGVDPDTEAGAERLLASVAGTLTPAGLAKAAHRLIALLDPDGVAPNDDLEGTDDELQVGRRADGSLGLKGRIRDHADAEMVLEVLDALSTPAGADDPRTLGQRRAEALKDLCAQALSPTGLVPHDPAAHGPAAHGTAHRAAPPIPAPRTGEHDDLPGSAPAGCAPVRVAGRALLTITMDHRWLAREVGHGQLDSDLAVDPATVRRWACDAGIVPIVLGARSQPLDIGRLSYTVTDAQRRALEHRDGGCGWPGCTRRPRRCHAHHVRHWAEGGPTDLGNLVLLCRFHHTVIHHEQWGISMIDGRPWFTPPAWLDPARTPRPGGRHLAATG